MIRTIKYTDTSTNIEMSRVVRDDGAVYKTVALTLTPTKPESRCRKVRPPMTVHVNIDVLKAMLDKV